MNNLPKISTVQIGARAEQVAAEYIGRLGYDVVARNYRKPHCEIDIVAKRNGIVYFIEVKYRRSSRYGGGYDYIGPQKLYRMVRAAETWVLQHRWPGEYALSAIEVEGECYAVTDFIESIDIG